MVEFETVRQELKKSKSNWDDKLVEYIVRDAKKLFCVSVVTLGNDPDKIVKVMKFFQTHGFLDGDRSTDFAIKRPGKELVEHHSGLTTMELTEKNGSQVFSSAEADRFCYHQWKVLVPVFSSAVINYSFGHQIILPFIRVDAEGLEGGAFSKVYKVQIRRGHFADPQRKVPSHYLMIRAL